MAAPVKEEMQARLGADLSDVRVHTDDAARASAAEIGAHAYTSGSHVVIGDGGADKHTLAHELTHVLQQRQGPVAGTDHGSGFKVSDPFDAYEQAAEANAARVVQRPSAVQPDAHTQTHMLDQDGTLAQRRQPTMQRPSIADGERPHRASSGMQETAARHDVSDMDVIQAKWVKDGGWKWDEKPPWQARLLCKQPPGQDVEVQMPKVLVWRGNKYSAGPFPSSYTSDAFPVADEKAQKILPTLIGWKSFATDHGLGDSQQILAQIIDVVESEEDSVMMLTAHHGEWLGGVSLYEFNGTTEGYPEIPEEVEKHVYVMFSAANPATQLKPSERVTGFPGGAGAALNAAYDDAMRQLSLPVFRHAANPNSYLSLLRAGYIDHYAAGDGFEVPDIGH